MSFSFLSKIKWLAAAALAAGVVAWGMVPHTARAQDAPAVQTYTDDAMPQDNAPGAPVNPGEITMHDVLRANAYQKKPEAQILPPVMPADAAPVIAPQAGASSGASSANLMLMQGLQSALQAPGYAAAPNALKPPTLHAPNIAAPAAAPPVATAAPVALPQPAPLNISVPPMPGVQYQPGQEPKTLGGEISTPAVTISQPAAQIEPQTIAQPVETPQPPMPVEAPVASTPTMPPEENESGECEPHVQSWTKTCAEAGYAANFTGHVSGETRTICPAGTLQDVWLSNDCAASNTGQTADTTPAQTIVSPAPAVMMPASADADVAPITGDVPVSAGGQAAVSTPIFTPDAEPMPPAQVQPQQQAVSVATTRADGSCGPANGLAADAAPAASELCAAGNATDISGTGPWRWACKGYKGGMTVSCAAPVAPSPAALAASYAAPSSSPAAAPDSYLSAPDSYVAPAAPAAQAASAAATPAAAEDAQCGSSDGVGTDQMPSANLCAHGVASRVSGSGPWNWACSGVNGGQAVSCTAPTRTDGQCGPASGAAADEMPTRDLCNAGFASAITGNGPWNWTCGGMNGGNAVTCSAAPRQDAVCGTASLSGHRQTPHDNLCSVGAASVVSGNGPWNWSCNGANGGSTVTCTAPISGNGICGSSNGVAASEAPSEDLCAQGRATRVVGVGPWSWNCSGTDGGDTQSCTAPLAPAARHRSSSSSSGLAPTPDASPSMAVASAPPDACGPAAELAALQAPDKDLCNSGTPSSVSGDGPWTWTCSDAAGHSSPCSTLSMTGELPEASAATAAPPSNDNGEAPAPAAAVAPVAPPAPTEAACGGAAEQPTVSAPSVDLCSVGKPSGVRGSGPWNWTCAKGKSKVACSVAKTVDATCGAANGSMQRNAPTAGLCSSGTPTEIQGSGPWLWSCVGSGGGVSVSCSATAQAQARVDGACGSAGNDVAASAPSANLCDSGVASNVYGDGPWTWTCSGLNGGIATSCSAQRNIPAAPPPPGPPVNGLCGASNGVAMNSQPSDDFCTSGTATAVSGNGPWNWNCLGNNGGMSVSCTAPLQPPAPIVGSCGAASGVPSLTMPRSGLCSAGISSAVSGKGPWTWSCSGTNGGGAVGCVAPLAGSGSGSLPSMTTPSSGGEPAPEAAPAAPVSSGLVTPRLKSDNLPPLDKNVIPHLQPSKAFDSPPEASALPPQPAPGELDTPAAAPDLPADAHPVTPPPIRDTLKPSDALKPPAIDAQGDLIPGNKFVLDDDISVIPFAPQAENVGNDQLPTLDKLAAVMRAHSNLRITLTAYAASSENVSPRDARRLSLTRALTVRDYLTAKGISSGRIDVRALGVNYTSGDGDRVDVTAN